MTSPFRLNHQELRTLPVTMNRGQIRADGKRAPVHRLIRLAVGDAQNEEGSLATTEPRTCEDELDE